MIIQFASYLKDTCCTVDAVSNDYRIVCSNGSCIYHKSKINPWILNDNGETTFDNGGPTFKPRGRYFSAECRRCQQMSDVKKGT